MQAPEKILELVKQFASDEIGYTDPRCNYNEQSVRREFIEPMFVALGWDVDNSQRNSKSYREVIPEDPIKVGRTTKFTDYTFRYGRQPVFFVEAKKPSVDIFEDPASAFQIRSYGWNAKLPVSILTNFRQFAVYDTISKPERGDRASKNRILAIKYSEYPERWHEIASLFTLDAIKKDSLERCASQKRRSVETVDKAFLADMERWRIQLAKNIALRNKGISQRELNYAVQATIDRIIFLRICEDRDIEPEEQLKNLTKEPDIYKSLCVVYERADERYNSGLFHFHMETSRKGSPDTLTPGLHIDDKELKALINSLYAPCPYNFAMMPVEILGQAYERFLGSVIRITSGGHQAKVEEKPEVRKAGGVYYTPQYIVDYIVEHTVGKLLEGKSPRQVSGDRRKGSNGNRPIAILDPSCGSGSFLVRAYRFLLDWHLDYYINHLETYAERSTKPVIYKDRMGQYKLTLNERKRILLANIYGVDIDAQAVEVTKLSLLLCVLEGEDSDAIQQELFHERALPDLDNNIRCGNSLIGTDFYLGQMNLDDEERYKVNAFDWDKEFPEIMKAGGFDTIIGNPPWGADIAEAHKAYLRQAFTLNLGKYESYIFFVEKAHTLLQISGSFGFITPSYWISRSQTEDLRSHLCGTFWPSSLIVLPDSVFQEVKMDSCILVVSRTRADFVHLAEIDKDEIRGGFSASELASRGARMSVQEWIDLPQTRFNPRINCRNISIVRRFCKQTARIGDVVELSQGLTLYRRSSLEKQFGKVRADQIVSERLFHSAYKVDDTYKKELLGRDVARYEVHWTQAQWVSYGPWLAHAVDERFFKGPRLVIQKLRNPVLKQRLVVGYLDDEESYSAGVLLNAIPRQDTDHHLFFVMGLLNSKPVNYFYRCRYLDVSIRVADLKDLPIPSLDLSKCEDRSYHDKMVSLVTCMLSLHKRLQSATLDQERIMLQRQIDGTDAEINRIVYSLYGLTQEEIEIVESALK